MSIDQYISELLYHNEVVILPNFGAFIATYIPAKINPEKKVVESPSKNLSFNNILTQDDNLLVAYIAEKEMIQLSDAKIAVDKFASECNLILKTNKKIIFPNIGTISLKEDGGVSFEQDKSVNYYIENFGLPKEVGNNIVVETKDDEKKVSTKNKISKKTIIWSFLGILIIGSVAVFALNANLRNAVKNTFSSIFSGSGDNEFVHEDDFANYAGIDSIPNSDTVSVDAYNNIKDTQSVANQDLNSENKDTTEQKKKEIAENKKEITKEDNKETVVKEKTKEDETKVVVNNGEKRFYIIHGAYNSEKKAKSEVKKLKKEGYNAKMAGKNKKDQYRVSYCDFASKKEADKELKKIKEKNSEAWILKY